MRLSPVIQRIGLYTAAVTEADQSKGKEEAKGVFEFVPLVATMPKGLQLGKSFPNADRLFDSVAQALAVLGVKDENDNPHSIKSLRMICHKYLTLNADRLQAKESVFDPEFIERMQYSVEEANERKIEPVSGPLQTMGKILSTCLNVTFHNIAITDTTPNNVPVHYYIEAEKISAVQDFNNELFYQRPNTIHLVIYSGGIGDVGHVVPILPLAHISDENPKVASLSPVLPSSSPDASFFDRIIMADDDNLETAGDKTDYCYSDSDFFCLMIALRKEKLRYENPEINGEFYAARGDEQYAAIRQNQNRIYLADPCILGTLKNSLLGDIGIIGDTDPENKFAWKKGNLPTLLIIPILLNAATRRVGHWCSVRVEISYENRRFNIFWSNSFGSKWPHREEDKKYIADVILEAAKILFHKETQGDECVLGQSIEQMLDQQGYGENFSNCGPIAVQNIGDFLSSNIPNLAFSGLQNSFTIKSGNGEKHKELIKRIRREQFHAYERVTMYHPFSARLTNAQLGDVNQVLSLRFQTEWKEIETNTESSKILDAVYSWPPRLISVFFQKMYQKRGSLEGTFSPELLQSTYDEMLGFVGKSLETYSHVMAFQGDSDVTIEAVFKAFGLTKRKAALMLFDDINRVTLFLETALQEIFLKETEEFIHFLGKSPELNLEPEIWPALHHYQDQIRDPKRFGLKITAAQISIFVNKNKAKLLPAYIAYAITDKSRARWPHRLVLEAIAKLQNRSVFFWENDFYGKLIPLSSKFTFSELDERDIHLLRIDEERLSLIDYAVVCKATEELKKPVSHLFRYFNPSAENVYLAGTFNNWLDAEDGKIKPNDRWALRKNNFDVWTCTVDLLPGIYEFQYVIDGEEWQVNPDTKAYCISPNGHSSVIIPPPSRLDLKAQGGKQIVEIPAGRFRSASLALVESSETFAEEVNLIPQEALISLAFEAVQTGQFELLGLLLGYQLTPKESLTQRIVKLKKGQSSLETIIFETENALLAFKKLDSNLRQIESAYELLTDPEEDIDRAWEAAAQAAVQELSEILNNSGLSPSDVIQIKERASGKLLLQLKQSKTEIDELIQEKAPLRIQDLSEPPAQGSLQDSSEISMVRKEVSAIIRRLESKLSQSIPSEIELVKKELAENESRLDGLFREKSEYLHFIEGQRKSLFLYEFQIPRQFFLNPHCSAEESIQREAFVREMQLSPDIELGSHNLFSTAIYAYFRQINFRLVHGYHLPRGFSKMDDLLDGTYIANILFKHGGGVQLEFYFYLNAGKCYRLNIKDVMKEIPPDLTEIGKKSVTKPYEILRGDGYKQIRERIFDYHKGKYLEIFRLLIRRGACLGKQNTKSFEAMQFAAIQSDKSVINLIKDEMRRLANSLLPMLEHYQLMQVWPQLKSLFQAQNAITWYDEILRVNQSLSLMRRFFDGLLRSDMDRHSETVALLHMNLGIAIAGQNPYQFANEMRKIFEGLWSGHRVDDNLAGRLFGSVQSLLDTGKNVQQFLLELDQCLQEPSYAVQAMDGLPTNLLRSSDASQIFAQNRLFKPRDGRTEESVRADEQSIQNNNNMASSYGSGKK